MQSNRLYFGWRVMLAIFSVTLLAASSWAVTEQVLHSFNSNGKDGNSPYAGLIIDKSGNLYGTTLLGGTHAYGTVFELTPKSGGGWTEKILHDFDGADGYYPQAGVIMDASGNLYGTTFAGGAHGVGTVYELLPTGGRWTEKVLHSFSDNGKDGYQPYAGLTFDTPGNLYGTTYFGGTHGYGTVFELSPKTGGWMETILYSFNGDGKDGYDVYSGVVFDKSGNLYGTTLWGGAYDYGTVYLLSRKAGGGWAEKVIHSFNDNGNDGYNPYAGVIVDASGNLYGTTLGGSDTNGSGTAYELSPKKVGGWAEKILNNVIDADGSQPYGGLIFDSAGNLYGTTLYGGVNGKGNVFELTRKAGQWTEQALYSFNYDPDGGYPYAGLVLDGAGNLYGTTYQGGTYGYGTMFEITP
jgi:uncharacterized repeat protein (TIGR03803 family)